MSIELFTPPYNYAICKMADRNFPGVVVQGDTLYSLYLLLKRAGNEIRQNKTDDELPDETEVYDLETAAKTLKSVLDNYEKTCAENGYGLPYCK